MQRSLSLSFVAAGFLALAVALAPAPARADLDLAGLVHLGGGYGTGDVNNNPYVFQVGGALELVLRDFVVGARLTQSYGTLVDCNGPCGRSAPADLRAIGADLGYEWSLGPLHVGPRLGLGYLGDRDRSVKAAYLEPGAVAEVQLGWFLAGVDVRYRVVPGEPYLNGLLGAARLGARF